jgi:tRNA (guanine-N7-)-methyltransferase
LAEKKSIPETRFYGRRKGRPMRTERRTLMAELLPKVRLPEGHLPALQKLFPHPVKDVWLEIGFGGGEHLAATAMAHPDIGFIGAEPFQNGIASLLQHIDHNNIQNIRIHPDDVKLLLPNLTAGSISRAFLLFPDPWPKARHEDRRFINQGPLTMLSQVLQLDAEFRIASDDPTYQAHVRDIMAHQSFFTPHLFYDTPPDDWPRTRYEAKALAAGRTPHYWIYKKCAGISAT